MHKLEISNEACSFFQCEFFVTFTPCIYSYHDKDCHRRKWQQALIMNHRQTFTEETLMNIENLATILRDTSIAD